MNLYVVDGYGSYSAGCCVVAASSPEKAIKFIKEYLEEHYLGEQRVFDIEYDEEPKLIAVNVPTYYKEKIVHLFEFGE